MCSAFWGLGMEADQGDLADIVRATGQGGPGPSVAATSSSIATLGTKSNIAIHDRSYDPNLDDQGAKFSSTNIYEPCDDQFGDPFSDMKEPLMQGLLDQMPGAVFFDSHPSSRGALGESMREDHEGSSSFLAQRCLGSDHEQGLKRPTSNIFSRMLQISPSHHGKSAVSMSSGNSPSDALMRELSPRGINPAASSMVMNDMIHANPVGVGHGSGMQIISSPRNNGSSIKRRKSQAKKVVCIPAPAAANSRSSGEVVPSDPWAWRKYGQKPIKGSPYPRGYYRCSSSKGCSARKQVERSRTDPNMLVITYTSEHNHPWPTQRNALAGSTRSHPPKGIAPNSSKGSPSSNNTQIISKQTNNNVLEKEPKESHSTSTTASICAVNCTENGTTLLKDHHVKAEDVPDPTNDGTKAQFLDAMVDEELSHGIVHHSANKSLPLADHHTSQQHDDFFADLGELEPDLNLMFCQGYPLGEKHGEGKGNKAAMDPFTGHFDWSGNSFGDS